MVMPPLLPALVGLLPVSCFLGALVYLDSYKLVKLRDVVAVVVGGALVAGASYAMNAQVLDFAGIEFTVFSRYVAPLTEELLKGLVILGLIYAHRIGFLIDAAIFGFAVGTGFAMVENLYFLQLFPQAGLATWILRGFGTAIMHGGASAIFAIMGLAVYERSRRAGAHAFLPGLAVAALLHSAFNHFFFSPVVSTLGTIAVLPPLLHVVYQRGGRAMGRWLGAGFDADTEMLALINSGRLSDSPVGRYLHDLRSKFQGPVLADLLCYLRLYTELSLRAKGLLMMRESGFATPVDEATREKFAEMRYLEGSIGRTGLMAIRPMLHMSHRDLWQLYMLGK